MTEFAFWFARACVFWLPPGLGATNGVLAQSEACVLRKHEVLGSKPRYSKKTRSGVLAQSEACVLSKDEVLGSKPRYSKPPSFPLIRMV